MFPKKVWREGYTVRGANCSPNYVVLLKSHMFWWRNLKSLHMCYFPQSPFPLWKIVWERKVSVETLLAPKCSSLVTWQPEKLALRLLSKSEPRELKLWSCYHCTYTESDAAPRGTEGCKGEIGPKHDWHQGRCVLVSRTWCHLVTLAKCRRGNCQKVWRNFIQELRCNTTASRLFLLFKISWLADIPDWTLLLGKFWRIALKMCAPR